MHFHLYAGESGSVSVLNYMPIPHRTFNRKLYFIYVEIRLMDQYHIYQSSDIEDRQNVTGHYQFFVLRWKRHQLEAPSRRKNKIEGIEIQLEWWWMQSNLPMFRSISGPFSIHVQFHYCLIHRNTKHNPIDEKASLLRPILQWMDTVAINVTDFGRTEKSNKSFSDQKATNTICLFIW